MHDNFALVARKELLWPKPDCARFFVEVAKPALAVDAGVLRSCMRPSASTHSCRDDLQRIMRSAIGTAGAHRLEVAD